MPKFSMTFDPKEEMFNGTFKDVSRDFILLLKEKRLLEKVRPKFVELMPETFDGELSIDLSVCTKDMLWVVFYLKIQATPEMEISIQECLSRDIDISNKKGVLEFSILVPTNSEYIGKMEDDEVILNF